MIRALYDLSFDYIEDLTSSRNLLKTFGTDIPSGYRRRDILTRIAIGDFDGAAKLAGLERKRIEYISFLLNNKIKKVSETMGTKDTKALRKEIVQAFVAYASSKIASNLLLSLLPTFSPNEISSRHKFVKDAMFLYRELKDSGILNDVKSKLRNFEIETRDTEEISVVDYIFERLKAVNIASEIDSLFRNSGRQSGFLNMSQRSAAAEVMKTFASVAKAQIPDPESLLNDEELLISEELNNVKTKGGDARSVIEKHINRIADSLRLNQKEESVLRNAAFSSVSIPFSFDRIDLKKLVTMVKERLESEKKEKMKMLEQSMAAYVKLVDEMIILLVRLDVSLAIAETSDALSLRLPQISSKGGIAFLNGMNFLLLLDRAKRSDVVPVSYSVGKTSIAVGGRASNVVMLTGANSGGKTTLLMTVACIVMLTCLGFPVPAETAEVTPLPLYLFRRKTTRKIGSLEHAILSLRPVFATRQRKVILMDEFEALTEPGAAGRILASIVNHIAPTSSLLLLVTHLARETLPHIRFRIRVDGIQALGLNEAGELVVERQPKFDQIGSSTPQLVIMKLLKSKRAKEKEFYRSMLNLLEEKGENAVQTPISIPWIEDAMNKDSEMVNS
jgi:dsDNA-specific endonuclease/ATPase MutS2